MDYLGLAEELKQALADYTNSKGKGDITLDQEEAVAVMLEKYEVCCDFFHGFDWSKWTTGTPAQKLSLLTAGQEHILGRCRQRTEAGRAQTEVPSGSQRFVEGICSRRAAREGD